MESVLQCKIFTRFILTELMTKYYLIYPRDYILDLWLLVTVSCFMGLVSAF